MMVSELKQVCKKNSIPFRGKKAELIAAILSFVLERKVKNSPRKIPEKSKALKENSYPLHQDTLILSGSYKNDLKTRLFFQKLVGEHFHFTVYGLDWIKERWQEENPPTYGEFATFWQQEWELRKKKKCPLKKEWAYLCFIQKYLEKLPNASRKELTTKWKEERLMQVQKAQELLKKML